MTIERLQGVMRDADLPLGPRELAETLWLAARLAKETRSEPPPVPADPRPSPPPQSSPVGPSTEGPEEPPRPPSQQKLHVPRSEPLKRGVDARSLLVPTAPMFSEVLAVQRALRPLKRRLPSFRNEVLDEDATVAFIADQPPALRRWIPIMAPSPERWLSLAIVVDTGPSMRLWRPVVPELRTALDQLGAFRDIRVWLLEPSGSGVRISTGGPPRDPATLIDPSGRLAVLVLSDCSGPHWWDGRAGRALHRWSRCGPVAILQPLPERLWSRTAAPTYPGTATLGRPTGPNTLMNFTPYEGEPAPAGEIPVPVLELSPSWLGDWAKLVMGVARQGVPSQVTFVTDAEISGAAVRQERDLPGRDRVRRFQATASAEAVRLAIHLAVSVPSLPVMRLIQAATATSPQPSHIAEVMLSGLLRPEGGETYDFIDGAREALLEALPRSRALHTSRLLKRVSEQIEARVGTTAEVFRALAPGPEGQAVIARDDDPFALVSPEALHILGRTAVPTRPRVGGDGGVRPATVAPPAAGESSAATSEAIRLERATRPGDRTVRRIRNANMPYAPWSKALLVWFSRYDNMPHPPDLRTDVDDLFHALIDPNLVGLSRSQCTLLESPTAEELQAAIASVGRGASDALLVYVSGLLVEKADGGEMVLAGADATADGSTGVLTSANLHDLMWSSSASTWWLMVDGRYAGDGEGSRNLPQLEHAAIKENTKAYLSSYVGFPGDVSAISTLTELIHRGIAGHGKWLTIEDLVKETGKSWSSRRARAGTWWSSRGVPGSRLPAYLVANTHLRPTGEDEPEGTGLLPGGFLIHARRYREHMAAQLRETHSPLEASGLGDVGAALQNYVDLERPGIALLIGGPGAGKSTFLRHLALEICTSPQDRRRSIPMFIYLDWTMLERDLTLAEAVRSSLTWPDSIVPEEWYDERLEAGESVVLLDGLDEIHSAHRPALTAWIDRWIDRYPHNDFVIASRLHMYISRGVVFEISDLGRERIGSVVQAWYRSAGDDADAARRAADAVLTRLDDDPVLADLAANPLLVKIIAALYRDAGGLPVSRAALCRQVVIALIDHSDVAGGPLEGTLSALALHMTDRHLSSVDRDDLVPSLGETSLAILDRAVEIGLLIENEEGELAFVRTALMDYFAAEQLTQVGVERYFDRVGDPSWRGTFLQCASILSDASSLVAACLDHGGAEALSLAGALAREAPVDLAVRRRLESVRGWQGPVEQPADAEERRHVKFLVANDRSTGPASVPGSPGSLSDSDLMERHVAGDPGAFGELVRRHLDEMSAIARTVLGDTQDAEDAVQEALLLAYRDHERHQRDTQVRTWLLRLAVDTSLRHPRRSSQAPVNIDELLSQLTDENTRDPAGARDVELDVADGLKVLSANDRAAVVLVYIIGYSVNDAAQILGITPQAVGVRVKRGRERLRPLLAHLRDFPRPAE